MTYGNLTDCLVGRNRDDVWCMVKLPPTTGCPPTVDELPEGTLRRLDYSIRERSQDPYDLEILWCEDESCYVAMACSDSEAHTAPLTDIEWLADWQRAQDEDEAVYGQVDSQ